MSAGELNSSGWWLRPARLRTKSIATGVSVGHLELMVTWPSLEVPGNKIQQHSTEYWNSGQKAPEKAWGQVT
jgi:hypothetical protein